eukprot:scaffold12451_cov112-Skeletonema_dohrnii-CCMP3373.AAC.2
MMLMRMIFYLINTFSLNSSGKIGFLLHSNKDVSLPTDQDLLRIRIVAAQLGRGLAIVQDCWIANRTQPTLPEGYIGLAADLLSSFVL